MSEDQKEFNAPSDVELGQIRYKSTAQVLDPSFGETFATCPRCGKWKRVDDSGHCKDCRTIVVKDPVREAAIDKRIHQVQQIDEIVRDMTDSMDLQELIVHGRWILSRKIGNPLAGIMGGK